MTRQTDGKSLYEQQEERILWSISPICESKTLQESDLAD